MKITIAPSLPQEGTPEAVYTSVTVEHPYDDLDITNVVNLVRQALVAWGFAEENVDAVIPPE